MSDQTDIVALRTGWDARYLDAPLDVPTPAAVLRDNLHLLPAQGQALDLACGRGGNALLLAQQGLQVDAWDLSPVAITQLQASVSQRQLDIVAAVRDVVTQPPSALGYDVIIVSYFLERALAPALMAALRPGGLLFYQTFGPERIDDRGPRNPVYRLARISHRGSSRGRRGGCRCRAHAVQDGAGVADTTSSRLERVRTADAGSAAAAVDVR